jgi:hypothetical protein
MLYFILFFILVGLWFELQPGGDYQCLRGRPVTAEEKSCFFLLFEEPPKGRD